MDCRFRNKAGICTIGCEEREVEIGDSCIYVFISEDDSLCPCHHSNWEFVIFNEKLIVDRITKLMKEP